MANTEINKGDKILLAIDELSKKRKIGGKITKEEMVVKVWKMFPNDFCIKGYPQYPNSDISKYVTRLFKENLLRGSFFNYTITEKGREYVKNRLLKGSVKSKDILSIPRQIESEITRIINSKVFKLYLTGETNFIESDLFDFLGTSSRSFSDSNKTAFISKFNLISKEIISFCEKNKDQQKELEKIILLWHILLNKFKDLLSTKIKI